MLAPFLTVFTLFMLIPIFSSIVLSFTNFNMVQTPSFVGMSNYWRILANDVADHFRRIAPDSIDFEPLEKNYRSFRRVVEFNNAFTGAVIRAMADSVRTTLTKANYRKPLPTTRLDD